MFFKLSVYIVITFLILSKPAYAYIDPGTGSFVVQVIAATAIGLLISIKTFWMNIKQFFLSMLSGKQSSPSSQEEHNNEVENN